MKDIIWDDLSFFVNCLKSLPVSKNLMLDDKGSCCVSTGTYSENWIYFPENITSPELVNSAVKFFVEREETFMWPLYSVGRDILEKAGLFYAGDITAMTIDPARVNIAATTRPEIEIMCSDNPDEWAITSWRAFGGSKYNFPENYSVFVRALSEAAEEPEGKISLYTAKCNDKSAGVFLLTNGPKSTGVYYFGVLPEYRRKGIARAMMNEICSLSTGKNIVLQSSPMGLNFYRNFGFTELFRIPVYSTDRNIV